MGRLHIVVDGHTTSGEEGSGNEEVGVDGECKLDLGKKREEEALCWTEMNEWTVFGMNEGFQAV